MKVNRISVLPLMLLACTAWASGTKPKVERDAYSGEMRIWISPHGGMCKIKDGGCISVGWQWDEAHPELVQMQTQVLYVRSPIQSAMVSIDGEETPVEPFEELTTYDSPDDPMHLVGWSSKFFNVPIDLARKMRAGNRVWVFVKTLDGPYRDRIRDDGKETKASGALDRFLSTVDSNQDK